MKFIIQTINGEIIHDFSFQLLRAIEFQKWLGNDMYHEKIDKVPDVIDGELADFCPVGSVEFVSQWLEKTTNVTPKPINIPYCLRKKSFSQRHILDVTVDKEGIIRNKIPSFVSLFRSLNKKVILLKTSERIKGTCVPTELTESPQLDFSTVTNRLELVPEGNYIISEYIDIDSEWRCFVYNNELVGLSNYTGDFTIFPNIFFIKEMIRTYSENGAPVAYTLDVGVGPKGTFVIEVHDFFSCGLYGFNDLKIYPFMLYRWWKEYVNNKIRR